MPKLNQVNAVLTSFKNDAEKEVTELNKEVQKAAPFGGRTRTYRPLDEEKGQRLPPENQKVQLKAADLVARAKAVWGRLWSLTLTQDTANKAAQADVVVDGAVVMAAVPVTNLLYLDKQLDDLTKFLSNLPTPDAAEEWAHDPNTGLLRSTAAESQRTSKEPTVIVKYPATPQHPAQTELFTKDVPVGTWTQVLFSGAIPFDEKRLYLDRAKRLHQAVKEARERANMADAPACDATPLLGFVFGAHPAGGN